jgi:hypothetical protein
MFEFVLSTASRFVTAVFDSGRDSRLQMALS